MKWLYLAWKNLGRNRRRTLATLLLTAVAVLGIMALSGFALYTYESLKEASMRKEGQVILSHPEYFQREENAPMELGLDRVQQLQQALQADPGIDTTLAQINFDGLVSNGEKSTIFMGQGVEPESFRRQGPGVDLKQGRWLTPELSPQALPEVLLGQRLAASLKVQPGDGLTLLGTTTDGVLNALDVSVRGIISTGIPELDARLLKVHLQSAQELLATDQVSQLGVYLQHPHQDESYYQKIRDQYPELGVTPWHERATFYQSVRNLYNRIFGVMGVILLVMVGFAIFNTASMSVMERTRELGTLAALGTRRREILGLFVQEALLIGLLGSLLGLLLAGGLSLGLYWVDVQMPPPPGQTEGYPLYIYWSPWMAGITSLAVVLFAVLAAGLATLKGINKPIVEALNHV
jgi:putative ABC transport system permease protein